MTEITEKETEPQPQPQPQQQPPPPPRNPDASGRLPASGAAPLPQETKVSRLPCREGGGKAGTATAFESWDFLLPPAIQNCCARPPPPPR